MKENMFRYIMEYSMYKTLACKYRIKVTYIITRYHISKAFGISYTDKMVITIFFFGNTALPENKLHNVIILI